MDHTRRQTEHTTRGRGGYVTAFAAFVLAPAGWCPPCGESRVFGPTGQARDGGTNPRTTLENARRRTAR